jgi:hypothetical protein
LFWPALWRLPALPFLQAVARTSYDGSWSVLIVIQSGSCNRAYRYVVQISHGHVLPDRQDAAVIDIVPDDYEARLGHASERSGLRFARNGVVLWPRGKLLPDW